MPDAPVLLRDHTTLRLGGPARAWVRATTEEELVAAVSDADAAGTPVLVLGGGSNLVVADEGFDGLVVEVATRGITPDTDDDGAATCGGVVVRVAAGEVWDDLRGHRRRARLGGRRGAVRDPRQRGGHPGPERRRLRPGGQPDHRVGARLGPHPARGPHLRGRRLPLRLPALAVQGRPRSPRGPQRRPPAPDGVPGRAGDLRRARPHPGRRAARARPAGGRARGRARAARRQGDGPRRRRPRHVERRLVLHQPVPHRPSRPPRCPTTPRAGSSRTVAPSRARRGSSSTPASARATGSTCAAGAPACPPSTRWR